MSKHWVITANMLTTLEDWRKRLKSFSTTKMTGWDKHEREIKFIVAINANNIPNNAVGSYEIDPNCFVEPRTREEVLKLCNRMRGSKKFVRIN